MHIIAIDKINISDLAKRLKAGEVLAMPTETVYGLIGDATNQQAIQKIYQIKGRDFKKPLPVVCASLSMVKNFFYLPTVLLTLAKKYWPGAVAIRFKIKRKSLRVSSNNTAVVRISSFALLTKLSKKLGRPLTATSANLAGFKECRSANQILKQFKKRKNQPDLLIDGGRLSKSKPSTIVALEKNKIVILRQGEIKIKN